MTSIISLLFISILLVGGGDKVWAHGESHPPKASKDESSSTEKKTTSHQHAGQSDERLGATVYKHMCVFCHGIDGNGGGKATGYLYPWPRDFRKGVFKHRSTPSGSLPLDKDIFNTIKNGIAGTAMPGWGASLTEDEIWAVIKYIKTFSTRFTDEGRKTSIIAADASEASQGSAEKGKGIFEEMRCARCHGTDLKGQGPIANNLFDIWDHRVFVYDLTNPNTYKWGFERKKNLSNINHRD